ncbi:gametogenetin-binding protein 2-like isoform X1 [Glossina fuscipes]|uniref:Gametogenetin-binding protein 2-like isoform X1 n=1 Tax=Glossina fuscipes TaxID=7396 RepID=A0A9C5ZHC3_9MUSC|nr:gametogenetin-binding protein 2-like isoform X1 [Glossina fuscipes]
MARLTNVYRTEELRYVNIGKRQLPVNAGDDNLMMLMDLNSKGLCIDCPHIRGKELEEFTRKFNLLTNEELRQSLEINSTTFVSVLNQSVQCVGCRRRVERLFYQLTLSGHPTLDPLILKNSCILTVTDEKMKTPQALGTLLYRHHEILNNLLESKLRNKTRCALHSLDAFRSKPFSESWREVWSSMKHNCRDELAVIETKELHEVLDNYLKKHKFCTGCRTKIEKAYKILVGETRTKEKGYVAALYSNIKRCQPEKHIHVFTNKIDFLDALIRRAEPEVNGSVIRPIHSYSKLRERHAKTLEIAQEEVLTCVGMIMYERLRRAYVSLREEERACQLLAAVGVHALCRSFDMFVEKKQGISNLELLYQEISRAEKAKEHKREQKKLKKKKKKNEKKNSHRLCEHADANSEEAQEHNATDDEDVNELDDENVDVEIDDVDTAMADEVEYDTELEKIKDGNENNELRDTVAGCDQVESYRHSSTPGQQVFGQQKKKKQKQKQKQKNIQSKISINNNNDITTNNSNMKAIKNEKSQSEQTMSKRPSNPVSSINCDDCHSPSSECPCESDVKDSGYGSEPLSQGNSCTSSVVCSAEDTSEGSEVSCSDGFCNHESNAVVNELDEDDHSIGSHGCTITGDRFNFCMQQKYLNPLSLQQMLNDVAGYEENEESHIPEDVVLKYQCQREKVQQQRLQLRETLRENFARLCMQHRRAATSGSKQ